ncbi:hypothetical protein NLG97_g7865 [Lecanicillium saksenae]|uniref:Uncharacterized protein n=1 Tax=Lecanicillium saksenae TaxID=468837 RepID=A0ACC1QLQ4_9HYPO|nr:hypothetical protein NLG97_g7865 [Lecanicillium saksenae]
MEPDIITEVEMSTESHSEGPQRWSLAQPFAEENRISPAHRRFLRSYTLSGAVQSILQARARSEERFREIIKEYIERDRTLVTESLADIQALQAHGRKLLTHHRSTTNLTTGRRCIQLAGFLDLCSACLSFDLPAELAGEEDRLPAAIGTMDEECTRRTLHEWIAMVKKRIIIDILVEDKLVGIPPPQSQLAFMNMGLCLADWTRMPQLADGTTILLGKVEASDERAGRTLRKPAATHENLVILKTYFRMLNHDSAYAVLERLVESGNIQLQSWGDLYYSTQRHEGKSLKSLHHFGLKLGCPSKKRSGERKCDAYKGERKEARETALYFTFDRNLNMENEEGMVYGNQTFDSSPVVLEFAQISASTPAARVDFLMSHTELMTSTARDNLAFDAMRLMTDFFPSGQDMPRADAFVRAGVLFQFCRELPQPSQQKLRDLVRQIDAQDLSDVSKAYWRCVQEQRIGLQEIAGRFQKCLTEPVLIEGFDNTGEKIQIKAHIPEQEARRKQSFKKLPKPLRDALGTELLENVNAVLATMTGQECEAALELISECGTIEIIAPIGYDEQGRANRRKIEEQIAGAQEEPSD